MSSRREFLQLAGTTALATASIGSITSNAQEFLSNPLHSIASGQDLLALQQRFVDLRFGMFLDRKSVV